MTARAPEDRDAVRSDWHRLGAGLSVRFTLENERFDAEWAPRLPTAREVKRVADRYREARAQFLAHAGRGTVLVLELG